MKSDTLQEEKADEYAESFHTGNFFVRIRKEAFLAGYSLSNERISELEAIIEQRDKEAGKLRTALSELHHYTKNNRFLAGFIKFEHLSRQAEEVLFIESKQAEK